MLSFSRNKVLIVSLLFAGLAIAGVGLLAKPGGESQVTEIPTSQQNEAADNQGMPSDSGIETAGTETDAEGIRKGPPALFDTPDSEPLTSAGYVQAFTALYKKSPEQFRERALQALEGPYPLEAQEAALTVWYQWNYEDRLSPFRKILLGEDHAVAMPASRPATSTDSNTGSAPTTPSNKTPTGNENHELAPFALDFLAKEAHKAVEAREVLASYIETKPEDPALRKQAWSSVLRWGRIQEIHRSLPSLYAERDPDCIVAAGKALQQTKESGSNLILSELSKRHPQRAARKQFKELLSQR